MLNEKDPHGLSAHEAGAKLDDGKTRPSLILNAMPRALMEVARVGTYGANKYSDGGWQHVQDGVKRYTDAMQRHMLKESIEGGFDSESGGTLRHKAMVAWNALAALELELRDEELTALRKEVKRHV